jgi:hypothetical protein
MFSTAMVITSNAAAPGCECGSGTLCCKVYALPELAKPPGVRLDENIGGLGFYIGLRAGLPVRPS